MDEAISEQAGKKARFYISDSIKKFWMYGDWLGEDLMDETLHGAPGLVSDNKRKMVKIINTEFH